MGTIPVLGLAGWSGSGKTTLLEKVIPCLRQKGIRTAVIKHDVHGLSECEEGKDSWRFKQAGAMQCVLCGPGGQGPGTLSEALSAATDVDLILVEGFKNADIPQIGIARAANQKGFTAPVSRFLALVTDELPEEQEVPCFGMNDIEGIVEFIMENREDFTHFNEQGRAKMVDVGAKDPTRRTAVAGARVLVNEETFGLIQSGGVKKGDVLTVAQISGIMGAKRTSELIPMCHPVQVDGINLSLMLDPEAHAVEIEATVSCAGRTGVEMEALTAVSTAALTVYDMCKAVQRDIMITDIRLLQKTGGVHGDYRREEA